MTRIPAPIRRFGGAGYLLEGAALLRAPALRRFVVWPVAISAVLWAVVTAVLVNRASGWIRALAARLPDWLDWLTWLIWPALLVTVAVAFAYGFAVLVALLSAPFYAALARRVELLVDPTAPIPPELPVVTELWRSVRGELRKFGYFALVGLPLLVSLWIPGINLITGPLWLVWTAWLVAVEYLDFSAGNHGHDFRAVRALARRTPLQALGFGAATLAGLAIPVLNLIVMPAAVAGATVWWTQLRQRSAPVRGR